MYLERPQMRVTRLGARLLLLMTLRMNMRPSEDNAQQSVPALPTNDQVHLRSNRKQLILNNHYPDIVTGVLLYMKKKLTQMYRKSDIFGRQAYIMQSPPDLIRSIISLLNG
jgi:hypothetical protein